MRGEFGASARKGGPNGLRVAVTQPPGRLERDVVICRDHQGRAVTIAFTLNVKAAPRQYTLAPAHHGLVGLSRLAVVNLGGPLPIAQG